MKKNFISQTLTAQKTAKAFGWNEKLPQSAILSCHIKQFTQNNGACTSSESELRAPDSLLKERKFKKKLAMTDAG